MEVILIVLIGIIIFLLCYIFIPSKPLKIYEEEFRAAAQEIKGKLEKERQKQIQQQTSIIKKEIEEIELILQEKRESYDKQIKDWEDNLEALRLSCEEQKQEISISIRKHTDDSQKIMTETLLKKQEETDRKIQELDNQYLNAAASYEEKILRIKETFKVEEERLEEKIRVKKEEINCLIEQFKKDEEARKEADFYRIPITSAARDDINKLKGVAAQLNNPSTLYKLIWKEYYENGFNSMIGRVLGDDKDSIGIYKITNIKNQMCYIGQTKAGFKNRWRTHAKRAVKAEDGTSNRLYQDMWENGLENYTFQIVEICEKDRLTEREKFYIDFFNSKEWGFNSKT